MKQQKPWFDEEWLRILDQRKQAIMQWLQEPNHSDVDNLNYVRREAIRHFRYKKKEYLNPLNPELNPICYLLALLGAHHFLHVSRIRVKILTFRRLMSYTYIYGAPILDVSRSHTTTQHSR